MAWSEPVLSPPSERGHPRTMNLREFVVLNGCHGMPVYHVVSSGFHGAGLHLVERKTLRACRGHARTDRDGKVSLPIDSWTARRQFSQSRNIGTTAAFAGSIAYFVNSRGLAHLRSSCAMHCGNPSHFRQAYSGMSKWKSP